MIPIQPYYLSVLVKLLMNDYFGHLNCLNFLSDDDMLTIDSHKPILVYNLSESYNISKPLFLFGCHGFVVYSHQPRFMFEMIEFKIRFTTTTKFHERRYLFVPYQGEKYTDNLFLSANLEFVSDIILLEHLANDGAYNFWTHKFVGLTNHKQPTLMDTWFEGNASFLKGVDLYPDKLTDQQGRVLRMNTFDYKPYINVETEHGFELMMAKEYAKKHNMSYSIKVEPEFWGVFFFENLTATGAKWTLWSDQVDLSIAQWYSLPDYTKYFDLTESTIRIGVTLLVPAPELAGGWLTPLFSFPYTLWAGFVLSYFGLIISFLFYDYIWIRMISHASETLTEIIAKSFVIVTVTLFLQQPLTIIVDKAGDYLRRMFVILLFAALLFAAAYTAGFASVMTIPRYTKGIQTTFDFDATGIHWGAIHSALLDGFKEVPAYQNIVKNFIPLTNDQIRHRMHLGNFAMMVERVRTGMVLSNRIDYMDLRYYHVLQNDLYQVYCVMLVRRSSILIPSIRRLYLIMKEAGLPLFWEEMAFQEENYKAINALRYMTKEVPVVKLQWTHVQGAFMALWLGLLASGISFVAEIVTYKHKTRVPRKLFKRKLRSD